MNGDMIDVSKYEGKIIQNLKTSDDEVVIVFTDRSRLTVFSTHQT